MEHRYKIAFNIAGKELETWIISPIEYSDDPLVKARFKNMAQDAVHAYVAEARRVPKSGIPKALAIYPAILPENGVCEPLDAFELK